MEADLIVEYLQRFHGNKKKVAEALGISRSYLYKRLAEINEQPDK
ncbi:helix-turn-helix domain-containing protein [Achromobacter pulmonis]|nr:helix-turn-helix domain-containing protein [Achromobacter pulmonis]